MPINTRQHGFRKDRSTETAISEVVDYIEQNIFFGKHVIATFLDIQAAFNTISPELIRKTLTEKQINPDMIEWYNNYITHRNIKISINETTINRTIYTGFPQGGVCSAKFWIIAFDEAIDITNELGLTGCGFADDCCTMIGVQTYTKG